MPLSVDDTIMHDTDRHIKSVTWNILMKNITHENVEDKVPDAQMLSDCNRDIDSGVCWWPWQLAPGETRTFLVCIRIIPLKKNTLGWSAVVSCACEKLQLLSVVFYLVRSLTSDLAWTKQLTNGDQWRAGHTVTASNVSDAIHMFAPDRCRQC